MKTLDSDLDIKNLPLPTVRMRRLREHPQLRDLITEHHLNVKDLILPLFVHAGEGIKQEIPAMAGHYQLSVDQLATEIKEIQRLKIPAVILFGIPTEKDELGSSALSEQGVIQRAIRAIKAQTQDCLVIADLCFCEYTEHGHCGVVHHINEQQFRVDNDATLEQLVLQVISLAKAGADVIAPSGMMDGMVAAIRHGLDQAGFKELPILSYAVKFASAFYGPFRAAASYSVQFGDRSSYQMNPANAKEALREAALDVKEGADLLMVKPAMNYLDVIYRIKQRYPEYPLGAYQVSGEFAMIKSAVAQGLLDEKKAIMESLLAIKRAGADFIITYFAKQVAQWLAE